MLRDSRPQALLVDDDESTCEMMRFLLRPLGLLVITPTTSNQALRLINSQRFDLYILDVWLPKVDGFALCQEIRNRDRSARILFYSGATTREDISRAYAAGADAYVVKPAISELVSRVEQLLEKNCAVDCNQVATAAPYSSAAR